METSQVSVLPAVAPAVHCGICGSVLKIKLCQAKHREAFSKTNEPTNFCCILSVWTLAGNLRMLPGVEKPQSHLYIVLFLMFVCMCVGVCMCVFKEHHPKWKRKEKKINNDNKYGGQQSRPLISSPSMQWIILEKNRRERKKGRKSYTVIVYHSAIAPTILIMHCFASLIDHNKMCHDSWEMPSVLRWLRFQ